MKYSRTAHLGGPVNSVFHMFDKCSRMEEHPLRRLLPSNDDNIGLDFVTNEIVYAAVGPVHVVIRTVYRVIHGKGGPVAIIGRVLEAPNGEG